MTEKMPTDKISMLEVNGVAQQKFATYGKLFLDEISGFMSDEAVQGNKIKESGAEGNKLNNCKSAFRPQAM